MAESYSKCYPDIMGATHEGTDGLFYKHASNGCYMVLHGDEWDYVTYLPSLQRLEDIRTTVSQKYEIKRLSDIVETLESELTDTIEEFAYCECLGEVTKLARSLGVEY
jgi:hypothetical protein